MIIYYDVKHGQVMNYSYLIIFFTMKSDVVKALLLWILRHLDDSEATLTSQRERDSYYFTHYYGMHLT